MNKFILTSFSLIFVFHFGISQNPEYNNVVLESKDSTFYASYAKVKQLYIERIHTPAYQTYITHANEYKKKWRSVYNGTGSELAKDKGGLKWIKANLNKTQFTTYDQAVEEFSKLNTLALKEGFANKKFADAYFEALYKYGYYIYHDLEQEMQMEYPEYF